MTSYDTILLQENVAYSVILLFCCIISYSTYSWVHYIINYMCTYVSTLRVLMTIHIKWIYNNQFNKSYSFRISFYGTLGRYPALVRKCIVDTCIIHCGYLHYPQELFLYWHISSKVVIYKSTCTCIAKLCKEGLIAVSN